MMYIDCKLIILNLYKSVELPFTTLLLCFWILSLSTAAIKNIMKLIKEQHNIIKYKLIYTTL